MQLKVQSARDIKSDIDITANLDDLYCAFIAAACMVNSTMEVNVNDQFDAFIIKMAISLKKIPFQNGIYIIQSFLYHYQNILNEIIDNPKFDEYITNKQILNNLDLRSKQQIDLAIHIDTRALHYITNAIAIIGFLISIPSPISILTSVLTNLITLLLFKILIYCINTVTISNKDKRTHFKDTLNTEVNNQNLFYLNAFREIVNEDHYLDKYEKNSSFS